MATNTNAAHPITSVPLARDEAGRSIPVPPEAAFWRVRRHTRGRPRNVSGVDREPLRLPLCFTDEDLHNMLGSGTYRLDLHDQSGTPLDITVAVTVGEPEPPTAHATEAAEAAAPSALLPVSGSDIRLVLEANVRAAQLAFQHNERTLAASLKMAETLRDGVHVLAESQADWIKAMANSRGFFRNAAPPVQPAPQPAERDDDEEDVSDGHAHLYALGAEVMKFVNGLVANRSGAPNEKLLRSAGGFDWRALVDWRRAARQPDDTNRPSGGESSAAPTEMLRLYAALPGELRAKLDHVRSQLSPQEQVQLVSALGALAPDELATLAEQLAPMNVDEIVGRIRAQLAKGGAE